MSHKRTVEEKRRMARTARVSSRHLSGVYYDERLGRYVRFSNVGPRSRRFHKRQVNKRIRRYRGDMDYGDYRRIYNLDNLLW